MDTKSPAHTDPSGPIREGFLHSTHPALQADTWEEVSRLRDETPVFRSDFVNPVDEKSTLWYLLDYDSVYNALRTPDVFSNVGSAHPFSEGDPYSMLPGELDPPDHTKMRRALDPYFAPSPIKKLEDAVRETAITLIEGFQSRGECDLVTDFALQFPTSVFMELMGLPKDNRDQLMSWVNAFSAMMGSEQAITAAVQAEQEVLAFLAESLVDRKKNPKDDFMTAVSALTVDGEVISHKEQVAVAYLFFQAGLDTVASQLGWTFKYLAENDELRQSIVEDPDLISGTVEEALRCFSVLSHTMTAAKDTEVQGCPIKKNDRVVTLIAAANRDPEEFPDAGEFDATRKPNRHIAFGIGPHRCIGSHLARLELNVALEEWHKRIPNYQIKAGADLDPSMGWAVTRISSLPLHWEP